MAKKIFDKDAAKAKVENLKKTVDDFAQSILSDTSGDAVFAKACELVRLPHPYSFGNLLLISWQAPDSSLVCSKTAFDKMAAGQGHGPVKFHNWDKSKTWNQHVQLRKGCTGVSILAPRSFLKPVENENGEETKIAVRYFTSCAIYRAEDVLYCDDQTPFVVPTLLGSVDTADAESLMTSLTEFAEAKGISVRRTSTLHAGNDGLSYGGHVEVRGGDTAAAIHPLLHELAHELLHPRSDRGRDAENAKKFRETEAESVAATVCRVLGFDTALSSAYLRNHHATPSDVTRSLDRIVGAAREILTWLREGNLLTEAVETDDTEDDVPQKMAA